METQQVTEAKKEKDVTVIVNGQQKLVPKGEDITFDEVVALSGLPTGPGITFTVMYRKGEDKKEGSLVEGESVKVKDGMIFDVTSTDKS